MRIPMEESAYGACQSVQGPWHKQPIFDKEQSRQCDYGSSLVVSLSSMDSKPPDGMGLVINYCRRKPLVVNSNPPSSL